MPSWRKSQRLVRNSAFVFVIVFIVWMFVEIQEASNGVSYMQKYVENKQMYMPSNNEKTGLFEQPITRPPYINDRKVYRLQQLAIQVKHEGMNELVNPPEQKIETLFPVSDYSSDFEDIQDAKNEINRKTANVINLTSSQKSLLEQYAEYLHQQNNGLHIFVMHTHLGKDVTRFVMDYVQYSAAEYNNITWCENQPWKIPPFLDHVCERPSSVIERTPLQIKQHFGVGTCQGLRMMYDFSLIDTMLQGFRDDFDLVLFLQDPVKRVLDSYLAFPYRSQTTLKTFVQVLGNDLRYEKYTAHNLQTRQVAGVLDHCSQYSIYKQEEIKEKLLETAKRNLAKFDIVFLIDALEHSMDVLDNKFKWRRSDERVVSMVTEMMAAVKSRQGLKISEKDIEIIRKAHSLDVELYKYAMEKFWHQNVQ